MPYSVPDILVIAKISEYLARVDAAKGSLFGKRVSSNVATTIYMERMGVQYYYNNDPSNSTLFLTAQYLYSLCRGYNLQAANIMNGGSGGSVSPVSPSTPVAPYQFIVDAGTSFIIDGQSSKTITSFIGFNILFARGGIPQSTVSTEPSYYSWNRTTGEFVISPAAITGELFQIYAI